MAMAMTSSLIDSALVVAGVISVLMAFVAALRGIEAPTIAEVRSSANQTGATLRDAA
ncbi:MAG TPA: hypothetical protein VJ692_11150 [Nitrospiraceae bacterium]|nr:hypothetical protein [Nitrospiraceae bacterium]